MSEEIKYLTFPVVILKDSITNVRDCVNNAMYYCLYDYCKRNTGTKENLIKQAGNFYGITWGNKETAYEMGKRLYNSIPVKSAKTSINKKMIFDFYENDKTEFEIITFLAFAAIRSIIQQQPYKKVYKDSLIGRMSGNNGKVGEINPQLIKYSSRYQLDKIKKELELNWGLKLYGFHVRGFYVSFKMSLEDLIKQVELRRKKIREKELREKKSKALRQVLIEINGTAYSQHL
jgi:hypothetical protein